MRKMSNVFLIALFTLGISCGKIGQKKDTPGPNDKVFSVSSAMVISREIPDVIELPGVFIPTQRLQVKSEFNGKVQALSVIEGQNIVAGEALLKIEDEKLPYVLDRQRAELKEAEAQLEFSSGHTEASAPAEDALEEAPPPEEEPPPPGPEEIAPEVVPPAEQAQAEVVEGAVPYAGARAAMLRGNIAARQPGARVPTNIPQPSPNPEPAENRTNLDQAKIDRIKAEIALTEKQLASGTIQSPMDGFVTKVLTAEGSLVQINDLLVEIIDIDPIELALRVPKEKISEINKSLDVKVISNDLPGQTFQGQISFIGAELDPEKKTLEVRIRIPNPDLKIKAGMEGLAQLAQTNRTHQGLLIPPDAVRNDPDNKKFVYVIHGQIAEKTIVETGALLEGLLEIKQGLRKSDAVVTAGVEQLKENEEFIRQTRL